MQFDFLFNKEVENEEVENKPKNTSINILMMIFNVVTIQ